MAGALERLVDGSEDVLSRGQLAASLGPSVDIFGERLTVTVRCSPFISLFSMQYWMMVGMPPSFEWTSSITYLPEGLRSARKGVASAMRWKSSIERSMPTEWAMAIM